MDIVREGETGYLFEPGYAAQMAERLEQLIVNAPLRQRLSEQAVAYARTQSWEMILDQLLSDYRTAISQ